MSVEYSNASEATSVIDTALATFKRDAAARSNEAADAIFDEMAKTLSALAQNPVFKNDIEFDLHMKRLTGVDDITLFNERVIALETYAKKIAQAHGVESAVLAGDGVKQVSMVQMPDHMSELEESSDPRTRLEVR